MSTIYAIYFYLTIGWFFVKNGKKMWQNLVKTFKMASAFMQAKQAQQMAVVEYIPLTEEQHKELIAKIRMLESELLATQAQVKTWKEKFFNRK